MSILSSPQPSRILVLGDLILDHYLYGQADRISPEAPVPVLLHQAEEYRLGGAANVALNLKELGAEVWLCGLLGRDYYGQQLEKLLDQQGISSQGLLWHPLRPTTCKTRVLARNQQLLRYDREDSHPLDGAFEAEIWPQVKALMEAVRPQVLIFQDYNKGLLSPELIGACLAFCRAEGIQTVVDPKKANFLAYRGVSLFKPNLKEIREALQLELSEERLELGALEAAALALEQALEHERTVITLGSQGLYIKLRGEAGRHYPTRPRRVADVCGAGDTVVSVLAQGLALGLASDELALLANLAGGQVCEKPGVVPVSRGQLEEEYRQGMDGRS